MDDQHCTAEQGRKSRPGKTQVWKWLACIATLTLALISPDVQPQSQQAYLKASNAGSPYDAFGYAVAVSGNTVVVGANNESSSTIGINGDQSDISANDAGAVFVFVRDGTSWSQQAYLKASNTDANDYFGHSVSISGDTLVVGAIGEASNSTGVNNDQNDNSAADAGAVYVFVRTGTTWSQQAYIKASNTDAGDIFGFRVALSGNTLLISAQHEDSNATGIDGVQSDNSAEDSGAVYVFQRNGTSWSQQAYLKASNTDAGDVFGRSVDISGETIVIGSAESSRSTGVNGDQNDNSADFSGAAYVFARNGTTWSQQSYLKASNTNQRDLFGYDVAISGDIVAVGAPIEASSATGIDGNQGDNSQTNAGAAYVFTRSGETWSQQAYIKASNTEEGDLFGRNLVLEGESLVVSAPREDSGTPGINGNQNDNSQTQAGAAYMFSRSSGSWNQQSYIKASNSGQIDEFGWQLALAGNILVIGAPGEDSGANIIDGDQHDNSVSGAGAVYVFDSLAVPPQSTGPAIQQHTYIKASNTDERDYFGTSVAISGNTIVVGAAQEDSDADGVNGDQADNSVNNAGAAYVFVYSGVGWSQQAYLKASNSEGGGSKFDPGDEFGWDVAISGDTVVVGVPREASAATGVNGDESDNSAAGAGAVYVFKRNGTSWSQQAYLKASNTDSGVGFGNSVDISGNTIVVGAPGERSSAVDVNGDEGDNSAAGAGAVYVFSRSGGTWSQQAYLKASNSEESDQFGRSVAISDNSIIVGAKEEDSGATGINGSQENSEDGIRSGAAYVFVRVGEEWSQQAYLKASNTGGGSVLGPGDAFGISVDISGDTAVVGAIYEDSVATSVNGDDQDDAFGEANFGAAYVFERNSGEWRQQAYIKASYFRRMEWFGQDVSIHGDRLLVGASRESNSGQGIDSGVGDSFESSAGVAFLFKRYGTQWRQEAQIKPAHARRNQSFGNSVATSDYFHVVSAVGEASSATGINGDQSDISSSIAGAVFTFTPIIDINVGYAGAWFNPETPGQGQLIDIEPESHFMFLSWFTFTDAASANPDEQHWFTAQGHYSGNTAELVVYETLGGRFDDPQEGSTDPVGETTLSFTDCGLGQMSYTIDSWELQGSFPLHRAIPGTEIVCQERAGITTEPLGPNDGRDGSWFDEDTSGQGFLIDAHPNPDGDDFIFLAWFTFGENTVSGQRWLTAQGPLKGTTADIIVYETTGGSFDEPITDETNPVGSMTIDFNDCSHALLTYSLTDEGLEGSIDIKRAIPGTEALCQELPTQSGSE